MKKIMQNMKNNCINVKYKEEYKIPKIYIFICYLIINLLIYGALCRKHYATDSYQIYFTGVSGTLLWSGRIAAYFISKIYSILNLNVIEIQGFTTMLSIIIVSIIGNFLFLSFYKKVKNYNLSSCIIIFLSSLLATTNFFILEWFLFPEEVMFYTIGMLAAAFAAYKWSESKNTVKSFIIITMFVLLAMYMYQMNMNIYIILAIIFIGIDEKFKINLKSIKKVIMTFLICFCAGVLSIITNKLVEIIANTEIRANFSFTSIIKNTIEVIRSQKNVWINGMGLMKYPWLFGFAFIMISLIIYILIKQKKQSYVFILLMLIVDYIIIFNPNYIASIGICMSPRVLIGLPYFLSILPITILAIWNDDICLRYKGIVIATLLFLLVPNIATMQNVITDHFATNKIDEEYAYLIGKVIDNYEIENNVEIKYIARVNDKIPSYKYEWIDYMSYDVNTRAYMWDWSDIYLLKKITNMEFEIKDMDSQVYDEYFKDKDWNYFNPHEQLIFKGDTLYWCKY